MAKEDKEKLIFISLQEASKGCDYSQEYLSLRARQGKLKSVKFGRNWITTKEWMEEYTEKSKEYNGVRNGNGHRTKKLKEIKNIAPSLASSTIRVPEVKKIIIIKVPKNLPVEKALQPRFGVTMAFTIVLFLVAGIIGQQVFLNSDSKNIFSMPQEISLWIDGVKINTDSENFTADLQEKFKEYMKLLIGSIESQFADLKARIMSVQR